MSHELHRVQHPLVRRQLEVRRVSAPTPHTRRVVLAGAQLSGFLSLGADDHIRIFLPGADGEPVSRDVTPRAYDADALELTIDIALHGRGPLDAWARAVQPGDAVEIGGPRGSLVVPPDFAWWLLIGDETAIPAIARRLAEMPAGTPVTTLVAVRDESEHPTWHSAAHHHPIVVYRSIERAADPAPFLDALTSLELPPGDGYVFIAAEASVVSALREYLVTDRGHPLSWLKAAAYWTADNAPTL